MKRLFLLLTTITVCLSAFSQKEELINFLDAYKTIEFSESKEYVKDNSFPGLSVYTISAYEDPSGITFKTDIEGISGYKALFNCKIKNRSGQFVEKKMIIVMYKNKISDKWMVSLFRESIDPLSDFNLSKEKVERGEFYTKKQYVYRSLAYWALQSGKLNECEKYIDLAKEEAKNDGDGSFDITSTESTFVLINPK